jgi:DNA-binding XRE family transcriptional regulator
VFKGPIPAGLQVRHQCHNRICCNPKHLLVGTHQDNKDDNKRAGLTHAKLVLSPQQVAHIKRLLARGQHTQAQLAAQFGVSQPTIGRIKLGKTWREA